MKPKWSLLFALLLLVMALPAMPCAAQSPPPFSRDIQAFRQLDSLRFPPKGKILFIGSSSFTYWKDVAAYFPGHTIINRGFGGSSLPDLLRYQEDIIYPYRPAQVVIYCGENDLAASDTVTAETVVNRFKQLFRDIRNRLPRTSIVFVSIKPSPSRWHMQNRVLAANAAIRAFLASQKRTAYVDVYAPMLGEDGRARPALFLSDSLHMTSRGYAVWQSAIAPHLLKK